MKLIVIMSVEGYAEELHRLYAAHHIPVFSELEIQGHHQTQAAHHLGNNWFGHGDDPVYSTLTFAFVAPEQADDLLAAIDTHNQETHLERPLRAFLMNVEQHV